jgi:adenylate cyclase
MGTEHRASYTAMGEPVAAAARLEQLARGWGARVLVSESVVEHCEGKFVFRELDLVRLPRRAVAVHVFELLAREGELDEAQLKHVDTFTLGLKAFRERRFKQARELFAALPDDVATRRWIERAQRYDANPPGESWDGTCVD